MKHETEKLITEATACLRLRDITLYQSKFEQSPTSGGESETQVVLQHKRSVRYVSGDISENDKDIQLLRVLIQLGVRIVKEDDLKRTDIEPTPIVSIEAEYLVDYQITADISEDAKKAFTEFNSVHNAWPFWRQQVFETCQKANLPKIDVPLFSGMIIRDTTHNKANNEI